LDLKELEMSRPRLLSLLMAVAIIAAAASSYAQTPAQDNAARALLRGENLLQQGHYQKAAAEFERASELTGGSCAECLLGVGRAYQGAGQLAAALQVTRMGLSLLSSPEERAQAYDQLGSLLALKGDRDAAEEAFRKARIQTEQADTDAP
jgi:tetratricopeptide (TPR) repeat protein